MNRTHARLVLYKVLGGNALLPEAQLSQIKRDIMEESKLMFDVRLILEAECWTVNEPRR